MSVTISLLKTACDRLGLKYRNVDDSGVFLEVFLKSGESALYIANNLGLNTEVVEKICRDKSYAHTLLSQYVRMPETHTYIDPDPPELYPSFKKFNLVSEIVQDIVKKQDAKSLASFPILLKPNSGSMGVNAFKCESELEVTRAIQTIFDKNSYKYDHVMLVQEYVQIQKEYRVLVYNHTIQFAYQKDNTGSDAQFIGNLSPLHFANAKAVLITDTNFLNKLQEFINPIFSHLDLLYGGLDIAQDVTGKLYLLEINSKPGFSYFVKDNGKEKVVKMLETILSNS